jgi:hypothetical protein
MSTRTPSLFRLGAVRRLPIPDGSWGLGNTSVRGTLETFRSRVGKPDGRLPRGYTRYASVLQRGASGRYSNALTDRTVRGLNIVPVPRSKLTKRVDDILEGDTGQGRRRKRSGDERLRGLRVVWLRRGESTPGGSHASGSILGGHGCETRSRRLGQETKRENKAQPTLRQVWD